MYLVKMKDTLCILSISDFKYISHFEKDFSGVPMRSLNVMLKT